MRCGSTVHIVKAGVTKNVLQKQESKAVSCDKPRDNKLEELATLHDKLLKLHNFFHLNKAWLCFHFTLCNSFV